MEGTPGTQAAEASPDIRAKVAFLSQPVAYGPGVRTVERIETHMSWVFLTETEVFKFKKPVRQPPHMDFQTLALRLANCREEVRLNRRLAADVYLGVLPLTRAPAGGLALDGDGEVVEWLVHMRRLPREAMLDVALGQGRVGHADVRRFTATLASFYAQSPPALSDPGIYRARLRESVTGEIEALLEPSFELDAGMLTALRDDLLAFLDRGAGHFDGRVQAGRVIEGHGDLRPEHVCLTRPPVFIDCLEFSRELRILDVADELAYLALECEMLAAPFVGKTLFDEYGRISGDRPPPELVAFYGARRALLRAKLCLWHLLDGLTPGLRRRWMLRARNYLEWARRRDLVTSRPTPPGSRRG